MGVIPGSIQVLTQSIAWYGINDPLLLKGQWGVEEDDLLTVPKYKIGDGVTVYSGLPYASGSPASIPGLNAVLTVDNRTLGKNIFVTNGDKIRINDPANTGGIEITSGTDNVRNVGIKFQQLGGLINNGYITDGGFWGLGFRGLGASSGIRVPQATLGEYYQTTVGGALVRLDGSLTFTNATNAFNLALKSGATANDITYILPTVDPTAGQVLTASAPVASQSTLSWTTPSGGGTPSLTSTQIAFGDGSNLMTSSSKLTFDNTNSQLLLSNAGTAALPTIGIGNATNGIYLSGTNQIGVSTNGVLRMNFDNTNFRSVTNGSFYLLRTAGSSTNPTYAFNGTTNTGAWLSGTDYSISVAGTLALGISTALTATFAGKIVAGDTVRLKGYTVAGLPAGTQGDMAFVTNALAPAFGATVAGGGAVVVPVFYDGTNWIVG